MSIATAADLVEALAASKIVDQAMLDKVQRAVKGKAVEPRAVAKELVKHGWVTAYQAEQLLKGRGGELVLGPYVLLEPLGEGGMGQVFKARHQLMNRIVAVKIIRKELLAQPDAVERFHREIRLAAQLDHPHLVRAHDAAQVGDTHFLVMELAEGIDLQRHVQQAGPLPLAQACAYIRQAALGLQHAGERGMVHRDIKPSNLQLTAQGTIVKILDIGLARSQAGDPGRPELTQARSVMGTPDYIAPEQIADPRKVDSRADIYSLGCTFYFLLAGRPPFPVPAWEEKLVCHRRMEPQVIEQIRPDVPAAVGGILRKMMAKQPDQRFLAPVAVADALAPFCALAGPVPMVLSGAPPLGGAPFGGAQQSTVSHQQTLGQPPVLPQPALPSLVNQTAQPEAGWTVAPGASAYATPVHGAPGYAVPGQAMPGQGAPVTAGSGQAAALAAPTVLAPMQQAAYPMPGQPGAGQPGAAPQAGGGNRLVLVLAGCGAVILLLVVLLVVAMNKGDKKADGDGTPAAGKGSKEQKAGAPKTLVKADFGKVLGKGTLPEGWTGESFRVVSDNGEPCLEVSVPAGIHYVELPAVSLKRNFSIEGIYLCGYYHALTIRLESTKKNVPLIVALHYDGKVNIGDKVWTALPTFKPYLPTPFLVMREGSRLKVSLKGEIVVDTDLGEVVDYDVVRLYVPAGGGGYTNRPLRIFKLEITDLGS